MYSQEIVISPDIFEKINKAFTPGFDEDLDLKSYKENLKLKSVLFDKNENDESILFDKIKEIMDLSSDFGKQKINSILKSLLQSGKIAYKTIPKIHNYCNDEILNNILNLSILSNSEIVNSEDNSALLLKFKFPELSNLELLNFEEFIKPQKNSTVFSIDKEIRIKRGEKFEFINYFKPYIYSAKKIIIVDRFLRKRNGGYLNLMRLLNLCQNIEMLEINTILKESSEKYKPDISVNDLKNEIIELLPDINLNVSSTGDHQRLLKTEDFEITIDPGFDFVNKDFIAKFHNVNIRFKKIYHNS